MQFTGSVPVAAAPAAVLAAFDRPEVLSAFLPGNAEVRAAGPGRFDFLVRRATSLIELRLPGRIEMTEIPGGRRLAAGGSSLVAGKVMLRLYLAADEAPEGALLRWTGDVNATMILARLLAGREAMVEQLVEQGFGRFAASLAPAA